MPITWNKYYKAWNNIFWFPLFYIGTKRNFSIEKCNNTAMFQLSLRVTLDIRSQSPHVVFHKYTGFCLLLQHLITIQKLLQIVVRFSVATFNGSANNTDGREIWERCMHSEQNTHTCSFLDLGRSIQPCLDTEKIWTCSFLLQKCFQMWCDYNPVFSKWGLGPPGCVCHNFSLWRLLKAGFRHLGAII